MDPTATNEAVPTSTVGQDPVTSTRPYNRILFYAIALVSTVAIVPLLIMAVLNYYQYHEAFRGDFVGRMSRYTTNAKLSLESFLSERLSALSLAAKTTTQAQLRDPSRLRELLRSMEVSFGHFVDLGLIDANGRQVAYAGPYDLTGKVYEDHQWFRETIARGYHVSDVFMGHRNVPHFVIAVRHDDAVGGVSVLRATIDTEAADRRIRSWDVRPVGDAFLVNRDGILQTPSRFYGDVLQKCAINIPSLSAQTNVDQTSTEDGRGVMVGHAQIERSPFFVMLVSRPDALEESWISLRRNTVLFLAISIVVTLAVVVWAASWMVGRLREGDRRRAALFHKLEYTNKIAAIGRLGAGVAHEINNPLAIINEKAGLLKDMLRLPTELPPREKLVGLVDSVLKSVERCGAITHRLLGFAKRMDVQREPINLEELLKEVSSFIEREASYRGIEVRLHAEEDAPSIESDRGQLQQVFLNILNNAIAAMDQAGSVDIHIKKAGRDTVAVSIRDTGTGISEEHLPHIFDPFYTTKKGSGTGLGLSITHGIVQKLGGQIGVESKVGEGTMFTVTLPLSHQPMEQGRPS